MLYSAYETRRRLIAPFFGMASIQASALRTLPDPLARLAPVRAQRALAETICALELTHRHPDFGIPSVDVAGENVPVEEERVLSSPFGTLLRFTKPTIGPQPRILVVPGLAGHFGSLVRGTVRTLLPDHDVYVADWHNARDVPAQAGPFGLDEYIEHLIDFLSEIGPGAHLMAVCQPCVPALASAAVMAADNHPAQPSSLILMAGPVDARINPGPVNQAATRASFQRLARAMITTVPWPHRGAGRRVYPGFVQATAFLNMAPKRHLEAFAGLFRDVLIGSEDAAAKTIDFYDEYFAVLDVAAEFYLDTATRVFREYELARGRMYWKGRRVEPSAIRSALLTIEAEKDELCPPGQTKAAHALCTSIPKSRKRHHLQPGVGHYGVFSGSRFDEEIYPVIRAFVAENDRVPG